MLNIERLGRNTVLLSNGVRIRARGPVAEAHVVCDVILVVLEWLSGPSAAAVRRVRYENVYAYDSQGRVLWRVQPVFRRMRGQSYTGLVDHCTTPIFHLACGWHAMVNLETGRSLYDCRESWPAAWCFRHRPMSAGRPAPTSRQARTCGERQARSHFTARPGRK